MTSSSVTPDHACSDALMAASVSRAPKILLFYQDFGAMGGIERYLIQAATLLQAEGRYEPVVVCCADTPLARALQQAGVRVYGLTVHPLFGRSILRMLDFFSWRKLRQIVRLERPVLAHVHIGLLENLWLKAWGLPVVYTVHGYGSLYSAAGAMNPLKRLWKVGVKTLFRVMAKRLDVLLFVSQAEYQRMRQEGFVDASTPAEILHNGVPVVELQARVGALDPATEKEKLGLPASARCVSFINRMDANKNPMAVLQLAEAFAQDPALSDVYFLLAGNGPLLAEVQRRAARLPNVKVLGYCPEIAPLLAVSDVVVYPARQEGFGLGLVEALAVGVPCVAYASGGACEILSPLEMGVAPQALVPVDDVTALARAVQAHLDQVKSVDIYALQRRASDFDVAPWITRLEAVYAQMSKGEVEASTFAERQKVSVILPVYNGEETIGRAVRSVLGQTHANLELIVVDDGSTDGTLQVLSEIFDPRLRILRQANQGVAAARNFAFVHATGAWMAFIDADDCWLPQKLSVELQTVACQAQAEDPVCLIYSSYYGVDDENRLNNLPKIRTCNGDLSEAVLQDEGLFLPSTTLVHRRVFEAVGGFKSGCYHEDRVFFIEACRQFPAYATGQRLVVYRQSLAGRCRKILQDYETALAAELSIVETLRETLDESALARLRARQLGNLMTRLMMYGYGAHARKVSLQFSECLSETALHGLKGRLLRFSLVTGINVLLPIRRILQEVIGLGLAPWWWIKTGFMRDEKTVTLAQAGALALAGG